MDKYIRCLIRANETARESFVSDFEFSEPREAVIFSQWMGAILPIDENKWFTLPVENEVSLPSEWDAYEVLSESTVTNMNYLLERRYVQFVAPMSKLMFEKIIGRHQVFDKEAYSEVVRKIETNGLNPQHFILIELNRNKKQIYNENFWKYVAGCYLRNKGYLITRRRPGYLRSHGQPDMCAYKTPTLLNPLRKHMFAKRGCFLFELELALIFDKLTGNPADDETDEHTVVVEAKCQRSDAQRAEDQLVYREGRGGYLEDGHFDEGYITGPDFHPRNKVGIISNTDNGELFVSDRTSKRNSYSYSVNKKNVLLQAERLGKFVLAKNLSLSRLLLLCGHKPYDKITFKEFLNELSLVLEHLTVNDLCSFVQEERLVR